MYTTKITLPNHHAVAHHSELHSKAYMKGMPRVRRERKKNLARWVKWWQLELVRCCCCHRVIMYRSFYTFVFYFRAAAQRTVLDIGNLVLVALEKRVPFFLLMIFKHSHGARKTHGGRPRRRTIIHVALAFTNHSGETHLQRQVSTISARRTPCHLYNNNICFVEPNTKKRVSTPPTTAHFVHNMLRMNEFFAYDWLRMSLFFLRLYSKYERTNDLCSVMSRLNSHIYII